jgi:site-specific recombinase XerD
MGSLLRLFEAIAERRCIVGETIETKNGIQLVSMAEPASFRLRGEAAHWIRLGNDFLSSLDLRNLSPATVRAYGYDLVFLFRWLLSQKITVPEFRLLEFLPLLRVMRERGLHPLSINRRMSTCFLFREFISIESAPVRTSMRSHAPYRRHCGMGLRYRRGKTRNREKLRVKTPQKLIVPLTPEDVAQFTKNVTRYRDLAIISLMLLGGLRCCEVLNLRLEDIDPYERQLHPRGKGRKERIIPIHNDAFDALDRYLRFERPPLSATNRVFVVLQGGRRGEPMRVSGLRNLFRYRRKVSGVSSANAHRFRHTFGTDLAKSGMKLPVLQRLLGHSDPTTTLQYIHFSQADLHEEYQKALKQIQSRYEHSSF